MATDHPKILGQAYPPAAALTTLYMVPAATYTVISTITVCNQGASPAKFRLSAAIAGAADTPAQYFRFDVTIAPNDGFDLALGLALATTDVIRCQSDTGLVSFIAFGDEVA